MHKDYRGNKIAAEAFWGYRTKFTVEFLGAELFVCKRLGSFKSKITADSGINPDGNTGVVESILEDVERFCIWTKIICILPLNKMDIVICWR